MGFSLEKRRFFVAALGEERVEELERQLFGLAKVLEERGVGFKDAIAHIEKKLSAEIEKGTSPARQLVNDLLAKRPAESPASKTLRDSRRPGADYAADVLDGRVVQG